MMTSSTRSLCSFIFQEAKRTLLLKKWRNPVVCVGVSCLLAKLKREGKRCMVHAACDTSRLTCTEYTSDKTEIRTLITLLKLKDTTASFAKAA